MANLTPLLIKKATIYTEHGVIKNGSMLLEQGKIKEIYTEERLINDLPESCQILDAKNLIVIPGFIDGHIHGLSGSDVMDGTNDALTTIAANLPKEGTTSFVATTITQSVERLEETLQTIAQLKSKPGQAELLGIHLEGPFIEKTKAGAQSKKFIKKPDLQLFNRWQHLSGHQIKTITLAPEHDKDGHMIRKLYDAGVVVSAGHTAATFLEMKKAVEHGVRQVTHLCNAMSGIHHRDIGVLGAVLQLEELRAEVIADGIHVSQDMLQLIYDHIGSERLMLVTDSIRAKNLPVGNYELGGQSVTVSIDRATLENGVLAGSILRMIDGAKRMLTLEGVSLDNVIEMASMNPAKQLNVFDKKGSIAKHKDADLLLLDQELEIKHTICRGVLTFTEE